MFTQWKDVHWMIRIFDEWFTYILSSRTDGSKYIMMVIILQVYKESGLLDVLFWLCVALTHVTFLQVLHAPLTSTSMRSITNKIFRGVRTGRDSHVKKHRGSWLCCFNWTMSDAESRFGCLEK